MKSKIFIIIVILLAIVIGVSAFLRRDKKAEEIPTGEQPEAVQKIEFRAHPKPDDLDFDGLTNEEEEALGTSSTEFDTDGDGLSDYDEIHVWKTDPLNPDTDGDGFSDGWEVMNGYSPTGPGELER